MTERRRSEVRSKLGFKVPEPDRTPSATPARCFAAPSVYEPYGEGGVAECETGDPYPYVNMDAIRAASQDDLATIVRGEGPSAMIAAARDELERRDDAEPTGITPEGQALGHRYVMGDGNAYCPKCSDEHSEREGRPITVLDCDYDLDK